MEPVAYDYYYSSSEAIGYGQYPYHSCYLPQLPDRDSGYSNGSDVEFSYKVIIDRYACSYSSNSYGQGYN